MEIRFADGMSNGNSGVVRGYRWYGIVKLHLLVWIAVFFVFVSVPIRAQENNWKALGIIRLPGDSPPDFTLPSLDGGSITLSDLKGQVILLNFWATWCPPCRQEMPSMERLYKKLKDKEFTILAVDIMERPETVKEFVRKFKLSFPILLDTKGEVAGKYMAYSIPITYLVNKDGKAVGKVIGPRQWDGERAMALLDELLGE